MTKNNKNSRRAPAKTPRERELQLVDAAVDLAEEQLLNGTASAQVLTHYLKLGSSREALEQERLRHENELLQTKRELMQSQQRIEDLYADAIEAMRSYSGNGGSDIESVDEVYDA